MRTLLLLLTIPALAAAGPVRDHKLVAELVPEMDAIVPGETLTVCLNIKHDPEWHTYWKNPGIAGVPTKLDWNLPGGFEAGEIQWARPQRVKMAIYNTFGYEGDVTLLVDIKTPADLEPGSKIELKAKTTWMMCAKACYPSGADLAVTVPVAATAKPHARGKKLAEETRATMPTANRQWTTAAELGKENAMLRLSRLEGSDAIDDLDQLYFFSDDGLIDSHAEQKVERVSADEYRLALPRAEFGPKLPEALSGVLLMTYKSGSRTKALSIRASFGPESKP